MQISGSRPLHARVKKGLDDESGCVHIDRTPSVAPLILALGLNLSRQDYALPAMAFWQDLFTGRTWDEFLAAGSQVTGFRSRQEGVARRIKEGDVLLAYLTGVKLWVGALEVVGLSTDTRKIWADDDFPIRFDVKPLVILTPEHGVPLDKLQGKVAFFQSERDRGGYQGFFRASPRLFARNEDGEYVMQLLREAEANPVATPVDQRLLSRKPGYLIKRKVGGKSVEVEVTVPEREEVVQSGPKAPILELTHSETRHTEVQAELLQLGADMGLDVWVARNDRGRVWRGDSLGSMPRVLDALPTQFNEITTRTIELIDVLWLKGNSIQAAFEVESTTSVYSGLLRMSDLLALQPNIDIALYLLAPAERRAKVRQEILRPTFQLRDKPLSKLCGFISFSSFEEKVGGLRRLGLAPSVRPDFLKAAAEYFSRDDRDDETGESPGIG